jgi:carbamoyl-phosphate synthase/aspartate carbamoyltransferase
LKDIIITLGQYSDAIVVRHNDPEWPEIARKYSSVPVINAGGGSSEHPTQALLDLHTIKQKWKTMSGLKVLLCGDLKNRRTVHSLIKLLYLYGCKIYHCPAKISYDDSSHELSLPEKYTSEIYCEKVEINQANDLLKEINVIYMNHIQKEIILNKFKNADIDFFKINKKNIDLINPNAAILHPLPRNEEISEYFDDDSRADYHERQVRNGLYIRTALLDYILYNNPIYFSNGNNS